LQVESKGFLFILLIKTLDKLIKLLAEEIEEQKKYNVTKEVLKETQTSVNHCKKFQYLFINYSKKTKFIEEDDDDKEKYMNSLLGKSNSLYRF
jgi:hypothetical protein